MDHLVVQSVSKSFGAMPVLNHCSLAIAKGDVLTLLGASGCGKTTLLKIIAGFITPDAGTVRVSDRDIVSLPPNRRSVGYVFQNYALFPHLTVAGNIAYGLKVRRAPRVAIAAKVEEAMALVGLSALGDRYPSQLSGGQQQRVAIARSLVLEPDVLLLDEPFNALDAALRSTMQVELRKLIKRVGITSVFVTHDQSEAMILSDTVAIMRAGAIEQVGSPVEVYDRPRSAYVADFLGRANIVRATARHGAIDGFPGVGSPIADGPVTVVLRPEAVRIAAAGTASGRPGTISFATNLGSSVEYEVLVDGDATIRAVVPRGAGVPSFPVGARVSLSSGDAASTVVFVGSDR